jgi:hypothetical protein
MRRVQLGWRLLRWVCSSQAVYGLGTRGTGHGATIVKGAGLCGGLTAARGSGARPGLCPEVVLGGGGEVGVRGVVGEALAGFSRGTARRRELNMAVLAAWG